MKKPQALLAASLLAPAIALAFETVDTLPWPSSGRFIAYPAEAARPTDLWVQAGIMHDDNVLRLEDGGQSEQILRFGAGVRHDQRVIGRQRVILSARADYYDFQDFQDLDHLAYSGLADWRWEVGNNLAGSVLVGRERRLADLGETRSPERSMVTLTRLAASGGYLVTPRLRLRAGVGRTLSERTERFDPETEATSVTGAAEYVTPLGNSIGVEARNTDGDAPVDEEVAGFIVNNDFTERELALVAGYVLGARLRTDARFGRTTRRYEELPGRDFEGSTWRARVEWMPANKTLLELAFYKEPRSIIDISASHAVVKGIAFGPSWAATSKLVFSARVLREDREFEGDPGIVVAGATPRDETTDGWRLGVGWEPVRHWQVAFALDGGKRSSNLGGRDYDYTALSANVAWRY